MVFRKKESLISRKSYDRTQLMNIKITVDWRISFYTLSPSTLNFKCVATAVMVSRKLAVMVSVNQYLHGKVCLHSGTFDIHYQHNSMKKKLLGLMINYTILMENDCENQV